MPNQIERDIYVLKQSLSDPIYYVQNTNMLPIILHLRDYDIPQGATAMAFCEKPSGKAVYGNASISGNDITVSVTTQMFAEIGFASLQIEITNDTQVLVTFDQPVIVKKNRTSPDAEESKNESTFFGELEQVAQAAEQAAENANSAAAKLTPQAIQDAVNNYLEAHPITVNAVPDLDNTTLDFPDGAIMSGTTI